MEQSFNLKVSVVSNMDLKEPEIFVGNHTDINVDSNELKIHVINDPEINVDNKVDWMNVQILLEIFTLI